MKKFLLVFLPAISWLFTIAQDELTITGTKKITKELTPQQVIDSLETRFPNAKSVKYFKVPSELASRGWAISMDDNISPDETIDYYTIKFKNQNFQYYGLYKADGTLVMSKRVETVTDIPEPIKTSLKQLSQEYPGYKVKSKTYYKNTNHSNSNEYYEFVASDGKNKKKVIYDGAGKLVKVK